MELIHDCDYISNIENKLVSAGYGEKTVHSLHFDHYFSEDELAANRSLAEILAVFTDRYDIHQTTAENSTIDHFCTDWDLFFWSNKGWNGKGHMDCFSLTFNDRRTPERNMALLAEVIAILENMEYKNIACRIQYDVVLHHETITEAAYRILDNLVGKPFEYMGMIGKIKLVSECAGVRRYGFFKKGAKKRYYTISDTEILAMNI